MANFSPLKRRFLKVLEYNLDRFAVRGRALDVGCGVGDVTEHLLGAGFVEEALAYDPSFRQEVLDDPTRKNPKLRYTDRLTPEDTDFDLALLFDVIEHVPDAQALLRDIHARVRERGWLAVTMPYNSKEWGFDDEFYGHLRRLSKGGVISLLERNGWNVVRILDPTFPTFWAIRRVFLILSRLTSRFRSPDFWKSSTEEERSLASSQRNSWNVRSRVPEILAGSVVPWNLVRRFDVYFESVFLGFEVFVLCQKRDGPPSCEVCQQGQYSYHRTYNQYALNKCGFCGSELLLPQYEEDLYNAGYYDKQGKRFPKPLERLVSFFRGRRVRFLRRLEPPEQSVLDIGCGRGVIPMMFKEEGWRAVGTQRSRAAALAAREMGAEILVADVTEIPADRPYGIVTLFHVVEHLADLPRALDHITKLVQPGGFLVLEYPNERSLLKSLTGMRWFAYDPPYHRHQINAVTMADVLGLRNLRMIRETHFSLEYSPFVFAQTLCNVLLPFQRDAFYHVLLRRRLKGADTLGVLLSVPLFLSSLIMFIPFQILAGLLGRGCIVRQVYRKMTMTPIQNEPSKSH
jgi:2-polyprenyl-3-methyl-5-hydroxy-6-metoxy-1,4-benzoquinol methylase